MKISLMGLLLLCAILLSLPGAYAGTITGTVTGPDGSTQLEGVYVEAYSWNGSGWDWTAYAYTDSSGQYAIMGLDAGTYRVMFEDGTGTYVSEIYDNIIGSGPWNDGTDIVVAEEGTASGIDASLAIASKITGTVTGPDGFTPLVNILVWACRNGPYGWEWTQGAYTDEGGQYEIGGLPSGVYRVVFSDDSEMYLSELYDDVFGDYPWDGGADIELAEAATVSGIDASLAIASKITGMVTESIGSTPLEGVQVVAYRWRTFMWEWTAETTTDVNGQYELSGLVPGDYRVTYQDPSGVYLGETYANASDLGSGTTIEVLESSTVSDIDAALDLAAVVGGTVSRADDLEPMAGVRVRLLGTNGAAVRSAQTDENGMYSIGSISPGDYVVRAETAGSSGYLWQWYDGALYVPNQNDPPIEAAVLALGIGDTASGIDFALDPAGRIAGTVIGNGAEPIANGSIKAVNSDYGVVSHASTDSNGWYELAGLIPGSYTIKAGADFFQDEWWDGATHENQAQSFSLTNGAIIYRDFDLASGQSPAWVEVTSDPSGADIYLDFLATTSTTPAVIDLGEVGERSAGGFVVAPRTITVRKDGHPRSSPQQVAAVEAETVTAHFDMTYSEAGGVSISTMPDGASVYVDYAGAPEGTTPVQVGNLAPGSHVILLKKDGVLQVKPIVAWVQNGTNTEISVPLAMDISGERIFAEVQSAPTGAVVYVDYLPATEVTDAVISWMDPASHTGPGWHSATHTIMLRKRWHKPGAPRYVPELIDVVQTNQVNLIVDAVAVVDGDGDGMPDQLEGPYQELPGWDEQGSDDDYDGDGASNYEEMIAGTRADDIDSVFEINNTEHLILGGNQTMIFTFSSVPGNRYFIQGSSSVGSNARWENLSGAILAGDYQTSYLVEIEDLRFFRLVVWTP